MIAKVRDMMMIAISVATVATTWPTSHQVSYLAVDAILAEVSSCSTVEITTLKAQLARLESAEANMASMLNATQAALLDGYNTFVAIFNYLPTSASTGTTASTEELSASVPEVPGAGTSGAGAGTGCDGTIISGNGTVIVVVNYNNHNNKETNNNDKTSHDYDNSVPL